MSQDAMYCSFCGKNRHEVRKLVAGPNVFICDECIALSLDLTGDCPTCGQPPAVGTHGHRKGATPPEEQDTGFDWISWMETNHVQLTPVLKTKNKRKKTVTVKIWYAGRTQLHPSGWVNLVTMAHRGAGPTPVAALQNLKAKLEQNPPDSPFWTPEDGP